MQGSGESSLSIWTAFDTITTASVRVLKHVVRVAWTRLQDAAATFAVVGTSVVAGIDIVQGQDSVITKPDIFDYFDETSRAVQIEYEREVIEPLGGVALAQADVLFENTDLRFTPNQNATIGTALRPNRPVNIHVGFEVLGQSKTIVVFKGLSEQIKEDKVTRTARVHCYDYLSYLNQYPLETTVYTNQRSDQIIESILTTIGFGSSQYSLEEGLNTIPFAWFEKGDTAGERIRKICEAEEGFFYQDEQGILRFENRRHYSVAPYSSVVWTIDDDDILSWESDESTPIINRCIVNAEVREVQTSTEIWRDGTVEEVNPGATLTIWANFDNPITTLETITATTDYVANSASDGTGTTLTSNIAIVTTLFAKSVKLEITNNGAQNAYMTFLRLRGTPAIVTQEIRQIFQDDDSVNTYDEQQLEVQNDFVASSSFAYYLARAIVRKYKDPLKRVVITVRGIPQLQLKDKVTVYDRDLATDKDYRIMKIVGAMQPGEFEQRLYLREVTAGEADSWAIVGTTAVASETEFVGF